MKTKHLSAFTILEALIGLILTGIIISLVYALFTLLNKQMFSFKNESIALNTYNLFTTILKEDIANASLTHYDQTSFTLKDYKNQVTTYKINGNKVLREKNGVTDTLGVTLVSGALKEQPENVISVNYNVALYNKVIKTYYYIEKNSASIINAQFFN